MQLAQITKHLSEAVAARVVLVIVVVIISSLRGRYWLKKQGQNSKTPARKFGGFFVLGPLFLSLMMKATFLYV